MFTRFLFRASRLLCSVEPIRTHDKCASRQNTHLTHHTRIHFSINIYLCVWILSHLQQQHPHKGALVRFVGATFSPSIRRCVVVAKPSAKQWTTTTRYNDDDDIKPGERAHHQTSHQHQADPGRIGILYASAVVWLLSVYWASSCQCDCAEPFLRRSLCGFVWVRRVTYVIWFEYIICATRSCWRCLCEVRLKNCISLFLSLYYGVNFYCEFIADRIHR